MNIVVKTTGEFDLQNPNDGVVISYGGAAIQSRLSSFVQVHLGAGRLEVVTDEVPEGLTNEEFQELMVEAGGDVDLALAGFGGTTKSKRRSKKADAEAEAAAEAERLALEKAEAERLALEKAAQT